MRKKRYNYNPDEKVLILKRPLIGREAISDLCDEYQLKPQIFYGWQKQFFEKGSLALIRESQTGKQQAEAKRIVELEEKLRRKHEVLSELLEEHIQLKKRIWGTLAVGFPMIPAMPWLILAVSGAPKRNRLCRG